MGINCSNCNCNWNEDSKSEIKDLLQGKYNKRNRDGSISLSKNIKNKNE